MLNLSRHIESLLLDHNCVIIPGFGGFITQYTSARYIKEEGIFLPPYRNIIFNKELVLNDGMLIQSYMAAYGICYTEAVDRVNMAISDMKTALLHNGKYDIHGIGTLQLSVDGYYTFIANEAGTISPNLYGLDALTLKVAETVVSEEVETTQTETVIQKSDSRYYTFKLRKDIFNSCVAAIITIICYFSWAIPVSNDIENHMSQAAFFSSNFITNSTPHQESALTPRITSEDTVAHVIAEQTSTSAIEEERTTPATQVQAIETGDYSIVLCSSIPKHKAEEMVNDLKSQGYDASVFIKNNVLRVIVGSYPDTQAAIKSIKELQNKTQKYNDAWVLRR